MKEQGSKKEGSQKRIPYAASYCCGHLELNRLGKLWCSRCQYRMPTWELCLLRHRRLGYLSNTSKIIAWGLLRVDFRGIILQLRVCLVQAGREAPALRESLEAAGRQMWCSPMGNPKATGRQQLPESHTQGSIFSQGQCWDLNLSLFDFRSYVLNSIFHTHLLNKWIKRREKK
jgi:hypothetical protein